MGNYAAAFMGSTPIISFGSVNSFSSSIWSRDSNWLPITPVSSSEQRFTGLYGVTNDSLSVVALNAQGSLGYHVDWGDGTSSYSPTNVTSSHKYNFASLSASTAFTHSSGVIMNQAIVNVIPSGSGTLTSINLQIAYPQTSLNQTTTWLDMTVGSPNFSSLYIGENTVGGGSTAINYYLERAHIQSIGSITNLGSLFTNCYSFQNLIMSASTTNVTNFGTMFSNCYSLKTVPLFDTSNGLSFNQTFYYCYSLLSIPTFNTSKISDFTNAFNGCYSLKAVPLLNTSAGTLFPNMFQNCYSLLSVPLFNTQSGSNFQNFFSGCSALQTAPLLNTSNGTSFAGSFGSCYSLQSLPLWDTSNGTAFNSMAAYCAGLKTIPAYNTSKGTAFNAMVQGCYSLLSVPLFNTQSGSNFLQMFNNCLVLKTIPFINTSNGTNFISMFNGCNSLHSVPALNIISCSSAANIASIFGGCNSLISAPLSGSAFTISYLNTRMSESELVNVFNNLATTTGQTITVTGTPGSSLLTTGEKAIATEKGWTLVL